MSSTVRKDSSDMNGKRRSSNCHTSSKSPKRKRDRPKTKKCWLLPAHAFSPNPNQSRITQKKGLYAFGKTSLRVSRDVYFKSTEESAARANEDLHKIIDLANCDHKSAKRKDRHLKGEATIMSKIANRAHSRADVSPRAYSEHSHSHKSESSVTSDTTSNSTKKTKRAHGQDKPVLPPLPVKLSERRNLSDIDADIISPMLVETSPRTSPISTLELPSQVLEDTTHDLLTTINIKLRELRRNKDGTCGDQYYRQIRHNLQGIHRQRCKFNFISKRIPKDTLCETLSQPTRKEAVADFQRSTLDLSGPPRSQSLRQSGDHRVKIPITLSQPLSMACSNFRNVGDGFLPVTDFTTKCDYWNNLPTAPATFISSKNLEVKPRKRYAPTLMQPVFSHSLQDSIGLDILDYADTTMHSDIVPVQEMQSNLSPQHSSKDNAIWQSLPVVSPIKLSPFSKPSPRFYRRKLY